jgi:hypothetical protein
MGLYGLLRGCIIIIIIIIIIAAAEHTDRAFSTLSLSFTLTTV